MARILITGSAQGLGKAAAVQLLDQGHDVVAHARHHHRAAALSDLTRRGATVVVGDLASQGQTRSLADQVNQLGRIVLAASRKQPRPDSRAAAGRDGAHEESPDPELLVNDFRVIEFVTQPRGAEPVSPSRHCRTIGGLCSPSYGSEVWGFESLRVRQHYTYQQRISVMR